jgi:hypothetical protein
MMTPRRFLLLRLITVYSLVGYQPVGATVRCEDVYAPHAPATAPLETYLRSSDANFETVKATLARLENIDTTHASQNPRLAQTIKLVQEVAHELVSAPPKISTLAQLEARSRKLRFLNTPAVRNLLEGSELPVQVARAAWAYNRALWDAKLSVAQKNTAISEALSKPIPPAEEPPLLSSANGLQIQVVTERILDVQAEAVMATIECEGFCGSHINTELREQIGHAIDKRDLKDGQTLSLRRDVALKINRNYILTVDQQNLPLSQIVKSALLEAENAGFTSLVMPALRTGYAFGAVEARYDQITAEIIRGISSFQSESKGTLKQIKFAVPKNDLVATHFQRAIDRALKSRERSLRDDTRVAVLSGKGFTMRPSEKPMSVDTSKSPIYRTMLKPWDLMNMTDVHAPLKLGELQNKSAFSQKTVSVLNMPIKFAGNGEFRIPAELEQFREFLQKMIDHEAAINPDLNDFYAYITVDQSPVKKGNSHRRGGIHIDGVQGARYPVKLPPEHTYSASDTVGTVFYPQSFDMNGLDPAKHHVHAELERQAKPENRLVTDDYGIYFWDSYSAHESNISDRDTERTFLRIEFSKKVYDGMGDTQNPMFDYNWPRVPRPIPENLDDSPNAFRAATLSPQTEVKMVGYAPELNHIQPWAPHTVKNLKGYLTDNLGDATVANASSAVFLIAVGEGKTALEEAKALGWKIGQRVEKNEGFHRVFHATSPEGKPGFVVQRVNGEDRILHVQSLLKLAGAQAKNIRTIGKTRNWRNVYKQAFARLGYVPDLVVYGFANTTIDAILLQNGFKNGRHFATLQRNYKKKRTALLGESNSDLEGFNMQILELADGRKVWFLHCMFGDLARDLVGAVVDHGAKNITFIGSGGSLDPNVEFGSMLIPDSLVKDDGSVEKLNLPTLGNLPRFGRYKRVPTPNVGTQAWTEQARQSGVDLVESELAYVIDEVREHSDVKLNVALVVSEVASGPNHRDMTEWGYDDLRKLIPNLKKVIDSSLGAIDKALYVIKSYRSEPILPAGTVPSGE